MSEALRNLNNNLQLQVKLYEELHNLECKKQKALMQNNLQEIELLSACQEPLLLEAASLEKARSLWVEHIARNLGKSAAELTLAELARHFPVLEKARVDLGFVVGRLQAVHGINTQLLKQAMRIVEYTLGLLTHQVGSTYTHPNRQEIEDNQKKQLLDWRI